MYKKLLLLKLELKIFVQYHASAKVLLLQKYCPNIVLLQEKCISLFVFEKYCEKNRSNLDLKFSTLNFIRLIHYAFHCRLELLQDKKLLSKCRKNKYLICAVVCSFSQNVFPFNI